MKRSLFCHNSKKCNRLSAQQLLAPYQSHVCKTKKFPWEEETFLNKASKLSVSAATSDSNVYMYSAVLFVRTNVRFNFCDTTGHANIKPGVIDHHLEVSLIRVLVTSKSKIMVFNLLFLTFFVQTKPSTRPIAVQKISSSWDPR